MTQQIGMKQRLQGIVAEAVSDIPKSERVIVDTGDGAALCFLGDPEEALFVALNLRDRLVSDAAQAETPFAVRIGINLGPVKVLKNLSGQQNPLGDGINNAQRVMSFAEPNQILVSRSFYDVIACLSQEYARLFHFVGTRKDKHIKEHAVYEVRLPEKQGGRPAMEAITGPVEQQRAQQENVIALAWDPAVLKTAERDLAQYIGPLAKVLVSRAAQQATDAGELYRVLADIIPDGAARDKFLAHVPATGKAGRRVTSRGPAGTAAVADSGELTPSGRPASAHRVWDPELLRALEQGLAVYLGPVAKVLVQKAAQKTSDLDELHQRLANEIPSAEQQASFLRAVHKKGS